MVAGRTSPGIYGFNETERSKKMMKDDELSNFTNFQKTRLHNTSFFQKKSNCLTLPETNISPENRALEKEIPIGNHNF